MQAINGRISESEHLSNMEKSLQLQLQQQALLLQQQPQQHHQSTGPAATVARHVVHVGINQQLC